MLLSLIDASVGWLLISLFLVVAGLWQQRHARGRRRAVLASGLLVLYLLLTGVFVVAHLLTGSGIDSAVVFHLQTGLDGSGWQEFLPIMAGAAVWLGLSVWLCRRLYKALSPGQGPSQSVVIGAGPGAGTGTGTGRTRLRAALSGLLLAGGWALHPGSHDLTRIGLSTWAGLDHRQDSLFVQIDPQTVPPAAAPRDLVWIYLESVERTYLDAQRFPGLTPQLQQLEQQALHFVDLHESEGAGWTIAGMVASQCGTPLLTLLNGNALTGADRFMSNATCLGDVLAAHGYQLQFMGGASLQFAGKGAFYRTHGFQPAGLEELMPRLPATTPISSWGLYDDALYEQAWQTLLEQARQPAPLGLVMLTLDTHHPKGHPTPACRTLRYGNGRNPMLNAVHCADRLVGDFVRRLQQHPRLRNALVVISSDHMAMPNAASDRLTAGPRRNLLMLLHPQLPAQAQAVPGTTLDVAPTVLGQLGVNTPALGYGRDLLGSSPTLQASMGPALNPHLLGRQQFLSRLWRHPDLRGGLLAGDGFLEIDQRQLRMPVLLTLDRPLQVRNIAYLSDERLPTQLLSMPPAQPFVWADRCNLIMPLNGQTPGAMPQQCVAVGQAGSVWHVTPLPPGQPLSAAVIEQQLRSEPTQPHDPQQLAATRRTWRAWTSLNAGQTPPISGLQKPVGFRVFGGFHQPSLVLEQPDIRFVRGLTLLRIGPDGQARKLAHLDTCVSDPALRLRDDVGPLNARVLQARPPAGHLHVLVGHDSVVCDQPVPPDWLQGAGLQQAAGLGPRQAYVGVWSHEGTVHEFSAPFEQSLTVLMQAQDPI